MSSEQGVVSMAVLAWVCSVCSGATIFQATMISYVNPGGHDRGGHDCDYIFSRACDHRFTFCFDEPQGSNSFSSCPYGKFTTKTYNGQNTVAFNNMLGSGISNPINLEIQDWQGGVKMKVDVVDMDSSTGNDDVDNLFVTFRGTPDVGVALAVMHPVTLTGDRTDTAATTLVVEFSAFCKADYYGAECSVYCLERDDDEGHYTCHLVTGQPICRPGWEAPEERCTVFADDCQGVQCAHDGTCIDGERAYACACAPGYTGALCGQDVDECASAPCANNASCVDHVDQFACQCAPGFVGPTCSHHVCNVSVACLNGGSCVDEGACVCPEGYTGSLCETEMCDIITCQNNGSCLLGTCECRKGFVGTYCSVDVCDWLACHHGATCSGGECTCKHGYQGQHCEIEVDECLSSPCGRTGLCEDRVDGFLCHCGDQYTGLHCESRLENQTYPDFHLPEAQAVQAGEQTIPDYGMVMVIVAVAVLVIMLSWLAARIINKRRQKKMTNENDYHHRTEFDNPSYGRSSVTSPPANNSPIDHQVTHQSAAHVHNGREQNRSSPNQPGYVRHKESSQVTLNPIDADEPVSFRILDTEVVCDVAGTQFVNPIYGTLPTSRVVPPVAEQVVVADALLTDGVTKDDIMLINSESTA